MNSWAAQIPGGTRAEVRRMLWLEAQQVPWKQTQSGVWLHEFSAAKELSQLPKMKITHNSVQFFLWFLKLPSKDASGFLMGLWNCLTANHLLKTPLALMRSLIVPLPVSPSTVWYALTRSVFRLNYSIFKMLETEFFIKKKKICNLFKHRRDCNRNCSDTSKGSNALMQLLELDLEG